MSDMPGGPEWFKASDGKWYPPGNGTTFTKKKGWAGRTFIVLAVVFAIIIISVAINKNKTNKTATSSTTTVLSHQAASSANPAVDDVTISKCDLTSVLHDPEATVAVTNHSSKTSDYIITVAFENPDGSQFGTGTAVVNALAAGQAGSDTASTLKDGAPKGFTCKVVDVTRTAS